jgi:hypothetical protein
VGNGDRYGRAGDQRFEPAQAIAQLVDVGLVSRSEECEHRAHGRFARATIIPDPATGA